MPHVLTEVVLQRRVLLRMSETASTRRRMSRPRPVEMPIGHPVACVDCGACVTARPVSAIAPNTRLD